MIQKRAIVITSLIVALVVVAVPVWLLTTEWCPRDVERVVYESQRERFSLPDTLTLVSWNIGYGGLGEDMDFFYDGGTRTRTSREQTEENLHAIISKLKELSVESDFILLQEVDFGSKRSYGVDQFQMISEALGYKYSSTALNYKSPFVPIPIGDPLGRVESGVVTLSRYPIGESVRYQYPTVVGLPNRLFDLKRCMLSTSIIDQGDTLWVNNTHNTAFDDGDMRRREVAYMREIIEGQGLSVTAGDWNSTPPGYTPSAESLSNEFFSPYPLMAEDMPSGVSVHYTLTTPSVRYLYEPYIVGQTTTTLVDFAILSTECRIIEYKTLDLEFKNSDHNPIIITFLRQI